MRLLGFERRWLLSLLDAILPARAPNVEERAGAPGAPASAADDPRSTRAAETERLLDDVFRIAPLEVRVGLRAFTWLVALSAPVVLRRAATVTRLAPAEREVLLRRFAASERYLFREIPLALKAFACLATARAVSAPAPATLRPSAASRSETTPEPAPTSASASGPLQMSHRRVAGAESASPAGTARKTTASLTGSAAR